MYIKVSVCEWHVYLRSVWKLTKVLIRYHSEQGYYTNGLNSNQSTSQFCASGLLTVEGIEDGDGKQTVGCLP